MKEKEKNTEKIHETKYWFFDKITKMNKLLSKIAKRQRENLQISKIRNQDRGTTTDT